MDHRIDYIVKKILAILFFLFSTISFALAQSPAPSPSDPQTLLKLQKEITKQVSRATAFRQRTSSGDRAYRLPLLKFDGCALKYRTEQTVESSGMESVSPFPHDTRRGRQSDQTSEEKRVEFVREGKLSLSDLDPTRIEVSAQEGHTVLTLQTRAGKGRIEQVYTVSRRGRSEVSTDMVKTLSIHLRDEEAAKQVAEAFSKAIETCGGKKGP